MTEPLHLLNAFRAFEATARHGSIKRAAQELNVTDGAVSRQVKTLEISLNTELFIRGHRAMHITSEAEDLAKSLSAAFETIIRATEKFERSVQSTQLVIAAPSTFTIRWLIPRLPELENKVKGTQIQLTAWNREIVASDRSVDIFITVGSEQQIPGMTRKVIGPETFGPVISPKIWTGENSPIDLLQLRRLGTNWPPSMWRNWANESGNSLPNDDTVRYERLSYALEAAEAGLGPTIAPGPAVHDAISERRLIAPFGFHPRDGEWALNWRTDRTSGLLMSVYRWFKKEFADIDPTTNNSSAE